MTAIAFIDTNVLLYAGSNAAADQQKRAIARQLLSQVQPVFSAQVLQQFYSAAVTKQRLQMTHDEAGSVYFPEWFASLGNRHTATARQAQPAIRSEPPMGTSMTRNLGPPMTQP